MNPRQFILPAYSLKAATSYAIVLTTNAVSAGGSILSSNFYTIKVFVGHGVVVTSVKGGYAKRVPVNVPLVLNASISYDEDSAPGATGLGVVPLNFTWSCTVSSLTDFGSSCSFGSYLNRHKSVVTIPSNQLAANYTYSVMVTAKSKDGRFSSQTISVTALPAGVPVVTIPSKRTKFNADGVLQLNGLFMANYSLYATWNVSFAGTAVAIAQGALTPVTRTFSQAQAVDPKTNYPLAIAPNTFIAGRYKTPRPNPINTFYVNRCHSKTLSQPPPLMHSVMPEPFFLLCRQYTFRLYAYNAKSPSSWAYGEVVLIVNSPPSAGVMTVTPQTGYALQTSFVGAQSGWIDDVNDYPLTYDFLYQLTSNVIVGQPNVFTIVSLSALSSVSTVLPPGLPAENNKVTVFGRAEDIYLSSSNVSAVVVVTTGERAA